MQRETVYVPKSVIDEALATPPVQSKRLLPSFADFSVKTGFSGQIVEDHHLVGL